MTAIVVLGSGGVVGQLICRRIVQRFGAEALIISHHRPDRLNAIAADLGVGVSQHSARVIDVHDPASIAAGITGADLVIVACAQRRPLVQTVCLGKGIPSVDLGVDSSVITEARGLPAATRDPERGLPAATHDPGRGLPAATQLMAAGLFPGLSGVMARHIYEATPPAPGPVPMRHPVDVGLMQSSRGSHGATGAVDMMRILSQPVHLVPDPTPAGKLWELDPAGSEPAPAPWPAQPLVRGFSLRRRLSFPPPLGSRTVRLAAFVERDLLAGRGVPANYWTGFDSRALTSLVATAGRVGLLRRFRSDRFSAAVASALVARPDPRRAEQIGLCASSPTHQVSYLLTSDYEATAACAVAMAAALLSPRAGDCGAATHGAGIHGASSAVRLPFEVFTLEDLTPELADVVVQARHQAP